jgi:nucleosome binding factor SPN SPT16 subunit
LAVKDETELSNIKKACDITSKIYSKYLKDQLVNIIDGEKVFFFIKFFDKVLIKIFVRIKLFNQKKMKHSKIAEQVEGVINDSKYVAQNDKQLVEICYPAIIQSGGNYNLKFSATRYFLTF